MQRKLRVSLSYPFGQRIRNGSAEFIVNSRGEPSHQREDSAMRDLVRKAVIAVTAVITITATTVAVPTSAEARWGGGFRGGGFHGGGWHGGGHWRGGGWGLGAAGLAIGTGIALAATAPYAYGGYCHTPTAATMMTTIMPTLVTRMDMAILTATDALTTVIAATIRPIAGLITAVIAVTIRGALTPIIGPTFEPPPIIGPTFEPAPIAGSGSFRLEDNSKRPLFQRSLFFCC